jgi:hypothetical protein
MVFSSISNKINRKNMPRKNQSMTNVKPVSKKGCPPFPPLLNIGEESHFHLKRATHNLL